MKNLLWLPLALALAACLKTEGPDCGGTAPVAGVWEYHGTMNTPSPGATSDGTLDVDGVDGCEFNGTLSITETPNGGGAPATLAGPVYGFAVNATVINFDAQFSGGNTRTHVAEVFGDSLAGEWIAGSGSSAPRGTFWARRTP